MPFIAAIIEARSVAGTALDCDIGPLAAGGRAWNSPAMRQRLDPSRLGPASFAALFGVLYALAAVPVIAGGLLPLVDYPNHLARMAVLAKLPHDPTLQAF